MLTMPAQFVADLRGITHEHRRITGPAARHVHRYVRAGHLAAHLDDLFHREALARAQVVGVAGAGLQGGCRQLVRPGQVAHIDVVADAGTIRRRVVVSEHLHCLAVAGSDVQDDGNQVCLRVVVFAKLFAGPGSVEVTQGRVAEPMGLAVPLQRPFDQVLALTVDTRRLDRRTLIDRNPFRRAEQRGSGGEDELADPSLQQAFQQQQRPDRVVLEVAARLLHALPDERESCEAKDDFALVEVSDIQYQRLVTDTSFDELSGIRYGRAVTGGQVVQHHDLVPLVEQVFCGDAADVTGAAGDQYPHGPSVAAGRDDFRDRRRPSGYMMRGWIP